MSEKDTPRGQNPTSKNGFKSLFRKHLPLESETAIFILVNMMDYFMTYSLLQIGGFREANPIANWFLEGWGTVKGLLYYKLTLVTLVCVIAQFVHTKRPVTARWILVIGILVVSYVVIHGGMLLYRDVQPEDFFS